MHLYQLCVGIKGAGEIASAIAWRLFMANIRKIFMMEIPWPTAVRRRVCFSEAIFCGQTSVENVTGRMARTVKDIANAWDHGVIPVMVDPHWDLISHVQPQIVVDAILAKKNLGTSISLAPLVIAAGPGFSAGQDAHMVIETHRGHHLGRIITSGQAFANTGIPGAIMGWTTERVIRAPIDGRFQTSLDIGDRVAQGQAVGYVGKTAIQSQIAGVIRGLIRPGMTVNKGMKLGDVDPRNDPSYCDCISDKARSVSGSVLEAILRKFNRSD